MQLDRWTVGPYQTATGEVEGWAVMRWSVPGGELAAVLGDVFEAALVAAQLEEWRVV